jgi:hypothetical protein
MTLQPGHMQSKIFDFADQVKADIISTEISIEFSGSLNAEYSMYR